MRSPRFRSPFRSRGASPAATGGDVVVADDEVVTEDVVDAHRLGQLGRGAQAVVFDLGPGLRLDDHPGPFVYKRYRRSTTIDRDGLTALVQARARLAPDARSYLDEVTVWPLRVVLTYAGAVAGVVLPRIPESFTEVHQQRMGRNRILRDVQHLVVEERKSIVSLPSRDGRFVTCRDAAAVLAFLHDEVGVCFGDISARNIVFRPNTRPAVLFLDCDGARVHGCPPPTRQLDSPDWGPFHPEPMTQATDCFKLGLFVLRCLAPGASAGRDPRPADDRLDDTGRQMLRAAINAPPAGRPTAFQWLAYFRHALGEPSGPPRFDRVELDQAFVVEGQPTVVRWWTVDTDHVDVTPPGDRTVRVLASDGEVVVHPTRSGPVHLTAVNVLGEARARSEPITVMELPELPRIPVLGPDGGGVTPPAVALGSATAATPAAGLLPAPRVSGGVPGASWSDAVPAPPPPLGRAVRRTPGSLRDGVTAPAATDVHDHREAST